MKTPESTGSWLESIEKRFEQLPAGILFPCSRDFRCFPEGYGDFPAYFLWDPDAGIIDLGIAWNFVVNPTATRICGDCRK